MKSKQQAIRENKPRKLDPNINVEPENIFMAPQMISVKAKSCAAPQVRQKFSNKPDERISLFPRGPSGNKNRKNMPTIKRVINECENENTSSCDSASEGSHQQDDEPERSPRFFMRN